MDYPPSSQDLNVIERVWAHLRTELHASAPRGIQKRKDFIKRLHGAVRSLNTSGKVMLVDMGSGFQTRCLEVIQRRGRRIDYWVSSSCGLIANILCLDTSSDQFRLRASASKNVLFAYAFVEDAEEALAFHCNFVEDAEEDLENIVFLWKTLI